ncbi:hypothetical protein MN116_005497 [Schistosoma mekongi]|uniref:ETS domain-containing protein n=1 Tax=Schistosoma mekongi TaxID=38744 RepID=A0AAE2D4F9_SCHME|nr:hypothetical protein MN116_005497 [Schistosoma mekongi]
MLPILEEINLNCQLSNDLCLFKQQDEIQCSTDEKTELNHLNEINNVILSQLNNNELTSIINKTKQHHEEILTDSPDDRSWQSISPCSSESIDSFSSSRNDFNALHNNSLSYTNSKSISSDLLSELINLDNFSTMNILSIPNHFENSLDPSLFYMDHYKQNYYSSSVYNDYTNDQLEKIDDLFNNEQINKSTLDSNQNNNNNNSNSNNSNNSSQLKTLISNDQNHCSDQSPVSSLSMDNLSNYHSPNDLDNQMDTDDIAWMDALDVSGLGIDDTSQIFSTVNSFKFIPEEMNKCDYYSLNDKLKQNSIFNENEPNNTSNDNNNSNKELNQFTLILNNEEKDKEHNTDSTLTCSEAEYYHNLLKQKRLKKHRFMKRKSKLYKSPNEWSSDSSSCDDYVDEIESEKKRHNDDNDADSDDDVDDVDEDDRNQRTIYHSICNLNKFNKPYSSQSTIEINENESWWPNPVTRRMHKDFHSTLWLTNTSLDNNKINTIDYYYESDSQKSNSSLNEIKIKRRPHHHHHRRRRRHHKIKFRRGKFSPSIINNHSYYSVKRKNKQMELWQFILCHLETCKDSAFQWVNKSTGLFRIVNTQLAAKEWGHYRNNKLMDYEKMARAMRFYYKDSILRKSRQQLHFQFAMPYVQWAEKFYSKKK